MRKVIDIFKLIFMYRKVSRLRDGHKFYYSFKRNGENDSELNALMEDSAIEIDLLDIEIDKLENSLGLND